MDSSAQNKPKEEWNLSELILLTEKAAELEERIKAENVDINIPNAYLINKDPYTDVKLPTVSTSEDDSTDSEDEDDSTDTSQKAPPVTPATAKKTEGQNSEENKRRAHLKTLANTLSPKNLRRFPPLKNNKYKSGLSGPTKDQFKRHPSSLTKPRPLDLYTFECLNDSEVCEENQNEVLNNYLYGEAHTLNRDGPRMETEIYKEDATGKFVKVKRIKDHSRENELSRLGNPTCWWHTPKRRNLWGNPFMAAGSTLFSHVEHKKSVIPPLKNKTKAKTSNFGSQFPPLHSMLDRKVPEDQNQEDAEDEVEQVYDGIQIRDIGKYCPDHPLYKDCSSRIVAISQNGIVSTDRSSGSSRCYIEPLIRPKPVEPEPATTDVAKKDSNETDRPKSEKKSCPVIIRSSGELVQHLNRFTHSQKQGRARNEESSSQEEDNQEKMRRMRRHRRKSNRQMKKNKTVTGVETIPSRTEIVQSIKEPITFTRPGFSMTNFLNLTPLQRLKFMRESFKNSQRTVRG